MAFLDWIKNRTTAKQQSVTQQQQKTETAKEMYTRVAVQETATQKPINQIPEGEKAKAIALGETINNASHPGTQRDAQRPESKDGATSQQPMRQPMTQQENAAPALSPTSAQRGNPESAKGAPASEKPQPSPKPAKAPKAFTQSRAWFRGR